MLIAIYKLEKKVFKVAPPRYIFFLKIFIVITFAHLLFSAKTQAENGLIQVFIGMNTFACSEVRLTDLSVPLAPSASAYRSEQVEAWCSDCVLCIPRRQLHSISRMECFCSLVPLPSGAEPSGASSGPSAALSGV